MANIFSKKEQCLLLALFIELKKAIVVRLLNKFKQMKLITLLLSRSFFAILSLACLGCNNGAKDTKKSEAHTVVDTNQVITYSTQYLFDNDKFPKEFTDTPMMVIRSEKVKLNKPFVVNGKEISYVNLAALTDSILNNWMKPKPFMEVVDFKIEGDSLLVGLEFKTVGKRFDLLNDLQTVFGKTGLKLAELNIPYPMDGHYMGNVNYFRIEVKQLFISTAKAFSKERIQELSEKGCTFYPYMYFDTAGGEC